MSKTVLVTGIRRIGKDICKHLLEKGYKISVVFRHSEESVKELEEFGNIFLPIRVDLKDSSSYMYVVEETVEKFGGIDAFIHLASPYYETPIPDLDSTAFYDHFKPILEAFLFISKYCFDYMKNNKESQVKGRIIAFGDWAVEKTPYKNFSAYFISKGALHTAVRVLAREFAPHVLVNCIALGPTLKPEKAEEDYWLKILDNTPLKREVPLKDVLNLVDFLLSTEGMTGEIINLDSGRHIKGS